MIKRPEQRVAILIDTQNMYHSAKHLYGSHLNFGKLVEIVAGERCLTRAIAYVATSRAGDEKGFLGALTANGIEVKSKDVIEFASGERKADWDVGMAIDAVKLSSKNDCIVLVTGDGDFVPLVEYLQNHGIAVEVAAFSESTSKLLREAADDYFDISEHPVELLMVGGGNNSRSKGPRTSKEDDLDLFDEDEDEKPAKRSTRRPPRASSGPKRKVRVTT